jgi:hypothetical protein
MAIFALLFGLAMVALLEERRDRRKLFSDGPCLFCYDTLTFDWSARVWVHRSTHQARSDATVIAGERSKLSHLGMPVDHMFCP